MDASNYRTVQHLWKISPYLQITFLSLASRYQKVGNMVLDGSSYKAVGINSGLPIRQAGASDHASLNMTKPYSYCPIERSNY
jgi:hypothetical protein